MGNKTINAAVIVDDSKSIIYKNKILMIKDIWQPHEVAKFKVAGALLGVRATPGISEEDGKQLDVLAARFLEKPVDLFEQKVADKGTEFQITYTNEAGQTICFGNTIVPFVIPKSARSAGN